MIESSTLILLIAIFFFIALLYSSVGFGGGSSYLAILSIYLPDFLQVKTIALLCNLLVVTGSTYLFYKEGLFDKIKFIPVVLCSVPIAFIAATISLTEKTFFVALGATLSIAGVLLVIQMFKKQMVFINYKPNNFLTLFFAGTTGFISGLVGIGGGILLSPMLNLINWDNAKKIAALASFFILVNSVAGLAGQAFSNHLKVDVKVIFSLLLAVFVGGQIGTRVSLKLLHPNIVKGLTGILVLYIGIKLVLKHTYSINF